MAQIEKPTHARVCGSLTHGTGTVNIHGLQIGAPALAFPSDQMINCLHIFHSSPQAAHVIQAGDSHFNRYADRQAGRARRRPQQNADLVAGFDQLTGKRPADEAGPAGKQNHWGEL
jgi:hypothetical protein